MNYKLFTRFLPVLLWMGQIFATSAHSNPADLLPGFIISFTWKTMIFGQRLFFMLGLVGHLVNFCVLAFLLARAIDRGVWFDAEHALTAFTFSLLYGVSDEIHQFFVPERTFQVRDIAVDGLGAMIGVGLYMLYLSKKRQKAQDGLLLL